MRTAELQASEERSIRPYGRKKELPLFNAELVSGSLGSRFHQKECLLMLISGGYIGEDDESRRKKMGLMKWK